MLTVDDANTIMSKYGDAGFFYELDFNKIPDRTSGKKYHYDFCEITFSTDSQGGLVAEVEVINSLAPHPLYLKKSDGSYAPTNIYMTLPSPDHFWIGVPNDGDLIVVMYITRTAISDFNTNILAYRDYGLVLPLSPLQIPVINGEFDNKFYVDVVGSSISSYTINGTAVTLQSDEEGYYLELPSAETCIIGTTGNGESFPLYRVTFRTFKSLPTLHLSLLYKGTPQKLVLIDDDTSTFTHDFQAYYKGRKLKDNIITLPYDAPDVEDIVVDLTTNKQYPPVRIKLKVKSIIYTVRNISGLNNALERGIKTIKVNPFSNLNISDKVFNDITFVDSDQANFINCTFNNVSFIQLNHRGEITYGRIIDKGGNTFNNCVVDTDLWNVYDLQSIYNNTEFKNTRIVGRNCPLYLFDGTITDCEVNQCIIVSDGDVTITNNIFKSTATALFPIKDYFPSSLYLTGGYTVKNNTFKLAGEWSEPAFNMCIIKSNSDFNPSQFINDNSFDLNIVYDDEPTDTFYYNIVDDDKIYARRLS